MEAKLSLNSSQSYLPSHQLAIPDETLNKWQKSLSLLTEFLEVAQARIVRLETAGFQAVMSCTTFPQISFSTQRLNPFSALFCEQVIATASRQYFADTQLVEEFGWLDKQEGYLSYLGLPLRWPDGTLFGVVAVLDRAVRAYSTLQEKLLEQAQACINTDLEVLFQAAQLELLHNATGDGIWDWNLLTNKLAWRTRIADKFDVPSDVVDYDVEDIFSRIHPTDATAVKQLLEDYLAGKTAFRMESRIRLRNGGYGWVFMTAEAIRDENSWPVRLVGSIIDITERKQTEERLHEIAQYYQQSFERSRAVILLVDAQTGAFVDVNPAACQFYGYSLEEMRAKKINDINSLPQEQVQEAMAKALNEQDNRFRFQHRLASGEVRDVEVHSSPINLNGRSLLFSIVYDITEQRKIEQALKDEHTFALQVMNNIGQGITVTDTEGRFVFVNPVYAEMLGFTSQELAGKTPYDITPAEDHARLDEARALRRHGLSNTYETRLVGRDGRFHYVTITGTPRKRGDEVFGHIAVITDLTERRRHEEAQRRQKEYLEALHATTLALINRLDLNDLLQTIIERAGAMVGTSHGTIVLTDPELGRAIRSVSTGYFKEQGKDSIGYGEGMMGQVWETGQPVLINNYAKWSNRVAGEFARRIQATVGLPLKSGSEVVGVLGLAFLEEGQSFNEEEVELLKQFAQLASLALANARLYTAAQRRLSELTTLQHVARAINSNLRLSEIFQFVVQQISTAFGYEMVSIYLCRPEGLELQAYLGYDEVMPLIRYDQAVSGRVVRTGQAAFIHNAALDRDFITVAPGTNQAIIVPLKSGQGEVLGTLLVETKGRPRLTEDDFALLSLLAEQVSVAVENARLFEELQQSEEKYRDVVDNAREIIIRADLDGRATYLNPAWEEIMGGSIAEALGENLVEKYVHPEDLPITLRRMKLVARGRRKSDRGELRATTKDGKLKWFAVNARPIVAADGTISGLTGTWMDITDRRQAEEQRLVLERKLLEAQKLESLGILAGGIAHDFNNLLVGILGNAGLALMELPAQASTRETIEQIQIAAQRAADLTRQMLAYSGKGRFVINQLDLNQLIEEMAHLLRASIGKNAVLHFNLAANLPGVEVDATQIRQVVMNLIVNASDAIGNQEGIITISTGLVSANRAYLNEMYMADNLTEGDYVYFEVTDTGCGMDAATQSKIFDPFFTTKFTGRGLGLAAVLGIVRGHKGALKVISAPGKGTTFRILLPCLEAPAVNPGQAKPPEVANVVPTTKGTILVVDDEVLVRKMAERLLVHFGFEVLLAADGRDALEVFRQNQQKINCVLLDMTMPYMDGEATFKEIHQIKPDMPVILMSGYSEQEATKRFTDKGLAGFLQKPYTPAELREKILAIVS